MEKTQLSLPFFGEDVSQTKLEILPKGSGYNLDFHSENGTYASHNFHPFPAKFPPQLPRHFIETRTKPGEIVLDPMSGSGTTILEAILTERNAIGTDIDPLAILIGEVKTTAIDPIKALESSKVIINNTKKKIYHSTSKLKTQLEEKWDKKTKKFIDYWFDPETQLELISLLVEIEEIDDINLRNFFKLAFSAIIITKTGGVSLALDLAHTRPHRAKLIYKKSGEVLEGKEYLEKPIKNISYATKRLRSPIQEFEKKVETNLGGILKRGKFPNAHIFFGNAENLPLEDESIDLIVTSPPYASNAIDYMRAHKFSLVWFGYQVSYLSKKRSTYIGGELVKDVVYEDLPELTSNVVSEIFKLNNRKGLVLRKYYSEMSRVLNEMYRLLKPGKSAVLVVGSSILEGVSTQTQHCLADIGKSVGFTHPDIMVRSLDRNRRMMPAGNVIDKFSRIQQRMHEEYILEFKKPS